MSEETPPTPHTNSLTRLLIMFHTKTDFVELNDEQLQNISGGLDVMAPEPGEPEEDDSWWLRMNGLPVY